MQTCNVDLSKIVSIYLQLQYYNIQAPEGDSAKYSL